MHLILLFSINLCISMLLKHAQGLVKFTCACAGIAVRTLLSELCKVQGLQTRSVKAQTHSACEEAPSSLALLEGRHCLILQGRHCFVGGQALLVLSLINTGQVQAFLVNPSLCVYVSA